MVKSVKAIPVALLLGLLCAAGCARDHMGIVGATKGISDLTLDLGGGVTMKLALIPAGEFLMGSSQAEQDAAVQGWIQLGFKEEDARGWVAAEGPQHRVRITKPFYMGVTEVTQDQWREVMYTYPWRGKRYVRRFANDRPMNYVCWNDAQEFCNKLSQRSGKMVRLPTEAEWEYACRAGSTTAYCFGDDPNLLGDYAWYDGNAWKVGGKYLHCVATKKPNAWGLCDMHGNVWEWCQDWYDKDYYGNGLAADPQGPATGTYRVVRGGSWGWYPLIARSANRSFNDPSYANGYFGLRVAVSAAPAESAKPAEAAPSSTAALAARSGADVPQPAKPPEAPMPAVQVPATGAGAVPPWAKGLVSEDQLAAAQKVGLPVEKELDLGGGVTMKLVLVPAGEFTMGSPEGESRRHDDEGPQHRVRITKPFYMGVTEVTKGQFQAFVNASGYRTEAENGDGAIGSAGTTFEKRKDFNWKNMGFTQGADHPVVCVSWKDAQEFCKWLSKKDSVSYRLPTEAEWEYACRAGSFSAYCFGDWESQLHDYAWYSGMFSWGNVKQTHPVGQKRANDWGLYDMHGNVWEWCQDWYDEHYYGNSPAADPQGPATGAARVARGGSWLHDEIHARSADRVSYGPSFASLDFGFRVVVVWEPEGARQEQPGSK